MTSTSVLKKKEKNRLNSMLIDLKKYRYIYLMSLPVIIYYLLFHYLPMYGAIISFKNFSPGLGIWGSPWVGFQNFEDFFSGPYFFRIFRNTILINFYQLIFSFPAPIILALLLNELTHDGFKRVVQTVSYMPHFISIMVICGLIIDFTSKNGVINDIGEFFGLERQSMLLNPGLFRPIYIISGIWQEIGWGSIIYLAALSSIDTEQYEAARIDGANRWTQMWNITLPGIMPTIIIMLILRIGSMMNVGFEKVILLYNPSIYETADVISSYVYRKGLLEFSYSYSAAVGLFNSVINFALLLSANKISRKVNEVSLW